MLTTSKDFKLELLNKKECKNLFETWGLFACRCYDTPRRLAENVGHKCFESGHFSGSRTFYFMFDVTNVPRSLVDQLVRHEQGVVKNVMSFRYVKMKDATVYIPHIINNFPEIAYEYEKAVQNATQSYNKIVEMLEAEGIKGEVANEQARGILPMNTNTGLALGLTLEAIIHLANERLCSRAEFPIRCLTKQLVDVVLDVLPELNEVLVAKCDKLMYCPEDKSCGYKPKKEKVLERLNYTYTPEEVYKLIMSGVAMKLPEWDGYWIGENNTIMMYCKDGSIVDIRETKDTRWTLDHIFLRHDWMKTTEVK